MQQLLTERISGCKKLKSQRQFKDFWVHENLPFFFNIKTSGLLNWLQSFRGNVVASNPFTTAEGNVKSSTILVIIQQKHRSKTFPTPSLSRVREVYWFCNSWIIVTFTQQYKKKTSVLGSVCLVFFWSSQFNTMFLGAITVFYEVFPLLIKRWATPTHLLALLLRIT